ncbi:MAG: hypothetical protein KDC38_19075, partial [Planctomycetes bacterium]|nr:hypothetical protein [Planctomycetota bacterium]
YTIANPVIHGLVDQIEDWPGAISLIEDLANTPTVYERPAHLRADLLPRFAALELRKPPELEDWTDQEYREEIARRVEMKCENARTLRRESGRRVVGRRGILEQSHRARPMLAKPKGGLNPRISAGCGRLLRAMLLWLSQFREEYESARLRFETQEWGVEFPFGTYNLFKRYGVNCSSVGPPLSALA